MAERQPTGRPRRNPLGGFHGIGDNRGNGLGHREYVPRRAEEGRGAPHRGGGRGGYARGGAAHREGHGPRNLPGRNQGQTYPMGMRMLRTLQDTDPSETISRLYENRVPLKKLLEERRIDDEKMGLLFGALTKACDGGLIQHSQRIKDILLLLHETSFVNGTLPQWVTTWPLIFVERELLERKVLLLLDLLVQLLHAVPDITQSLGVMLIILNDTVTSFERKGIHISPDTKAKLADFEEQQAKYQRDRREMTARRIRRPKDNSDEPPPNDFRDLPILPIAEELRRDYKPFLRTNIVGGKYKDVHNYLDIHFRLLREDFMQPLREGIAEYTAELAKKGPRTNKRFQNFRLYNNVRAVGINPSQSGLTYVLQFELERHLKHVKWDISKRLIYGSLICLSRDHFKSLIFGVIANRDTANLKQGLIEVTFDIEPSQSQELFSFTYKMAESSSYFEAYRHVLGCLQKIDQESFPFTKYLIETTGNSAPPKYLNHDCTFDLTSIVAIGVSTTTIWNALLLKRCEAVRVRGDIGWPNAEMLGFDESQMSAYQAALREEVCLIQGPPGTGKTYVGLKIVKTLLKNKIKWGKTRPMLVVCYTNHALDQFLEGILEFELDGVVRIGGRSGSEKLKDLNLNQIRRRVKHTGRWQYGMVRSQMTDCAVEIKKYKSLKDTAETKLLRTDALHDIMSDGQRRSLMNSMFSYEGDPMLIWLSISEAAQWMFATGSLANDGDIDDTTGSNDVDAQDDDDGSPEQGEEFLELGDDELERRFIDDEDDEGDFLRSVRSLQSHTPKGIALQIPNFNDQFTESDGWRVQGKRKPRKMDRFIQQQVSRNDRMTEEETRDIRDVWSLEPDQRWRLYRYWVHLYCVRIHHKLRNLFEEYDRQAAILKELRVEEDLNALKGQTVIGVTTTGAAKYNQLLRSIGPPIVIVEEAAEILEAHVITSITENTEHLILIGDHQQLRPNPTVFKLCRDYKLDVSLFERLIKNGMPCHRLSLQHRMRPEISNILRLHDDFYRGLLDHEMVKHYDHVLGLEKDLFFVDHEVLEQHDEENRSRSNLHEANFLTSLCKYLLQQGYNPDQITILTAYKGQVWNFKKIMDKKTFEGVRVCPIDNFQGEENDIILFSFVRSNEEGNIGFLKVSNRVCVALSRAKMGLYCIGNFSQMSRTSGLWKTITSYLQEKDLIGPSLNLLCRNHPGTLTEVSSATNFKDAPDGGCKEPCTARLDCGHTCQLKCHPEDKEHARVLCKRSCEKMMCPEHKCPRSCFEECGTKCQTLVRKMLPCGHRVWAACHENPEALRCVEPCDGKLLCGHPCRSRCSDMCTVKCLERVRKTFQPCGHKAHTLCYQTECVQACSALLKCGHTCRGKCGECLNGRYHVQCRKECKRILVCGHVCKSRCMPSCPPCTEPCENRCQHNRCRKTCGESCVSCRERCTWKCRHNVCTQSCGDDCDRRQCNRPCDARLPRCGHPCIGLCGEKCPELCRRCDKEKVTTILFGTEDGDDARFIQLADCKHIVEVSAMDKLMTQSNQAEGEASDIKLPECPWCKTPIRNNQRYNRRIKEIRADVELVKKQIKGEEMNLNRELDAVIKRISKAQRNSEIDLLAQRYARTEVAANVRHERALEMLRSKAARGADDKWTGFFSRLKSGLESRRYTVSMIDVSSANVLLDMYEKMTKLEEARLKVVKAIPAGLLEDTEQFERFKTCCELLERKIMTTVNYISEQELGDWGREYRRCRHTISLLHVVGLFKQSKGKLEEHGKQEANVREAEQILSDGCPFTEEKESRTRELLNKLKDMNPLLLKIGISERERDMIVKAMGFTRGHWFKCPSGHVYAIGDCGGATQQSECPECKTPIGGLSHELEAGNQVASEMDGARFAAYSEEANNLANFNLDDIF